jgi:glycine/D-amino acid oxidase-like deaminating enzyme
MRELEPRLRIDDLVAGCYEPASGYCNPVETAQGFARGYAGCFDVTPDWHPILDRVGPEGYVVAAGFSGHGFKLSPAVGRMVAALVVEGPSGHPDLPTFRLSRFAEGKPIRGTYGDWLMC